MVYSDKSTLNMYIISTKDYKIGTGVILSTLYRGVTNRSLFIKAMEMQMQLLLTSLLRPMSTGFYGHITKQTAS